MSREIKQTNRMHVEARGLNRGLGSFLHYSKLNFVELEAMIFLYLANKLAVYDSSLCLFSSDLA